jgi:hypothetical protein
MAVVSPETRAVLFLESGRDDDTLIPPRFLTAPTGFPMRSGQAEHYRKYTAMAS